MKKTFLALLSLLIFGVAWATTYSTANLRQQSYPIGTTFLPVETQQIVALATAAPIPGSGETLLAQIWLANFSQPINSKWVTVSALNTTSSGVTVTALTFSLAASARWKIGVPIQGTSTPTKTPTRTTTATVTNTASHTNTETDVPTDTPSHTPSHTPTCTHTPTVTLTPVDTAVVGLQETATAIQADLAAVQATATAIQKSINDLSTPVYSNVSRNDAQATAIVDVCATLDMTPPAGMWVAPKISRGPRPPSNDSLAYTGIALIVLFFLLLNAPICRKEKRMVLSLLLVGGFFMIYVSNALASSRDNQTTKTQITSIQEK